MHHFSEKCNTLGAIFSFFSFINPYKILYIREPYFFCAGFSHLRAGPRRPFSGGHFFPDPRFSPPKSAFSRLFQPYFSGTFREVPLCLSTKGRPAVSPLRRRQKGPPPRRTTNAGPKPGRRLSDLIESAGSRPSGARPEKRKPKAWKAKNRRRRCSLPRRTQNPRRSAAIASCSKSPWKSRLHAGLLTLAFSRMPNLPDFSVAGGAPKGFAGEYSGGTVRTFHPLPSRTGSAHPGRASARNMKQF